MENDHIEKPISKLHSSANAMYSGTAQFMALFHCAQEYKIKHIF
jgi:hypothetical protein